MRPLPRLHAVTDAAVVGTDDFPARAAAIAAAGPAVALHARDRSAGGATLARLARRLVALARPPEAAVIVNGRPDVARAVDAQGVQLGGTDLAPHDVAFYLRDVAVSFHSYYAAERFLVDGNAELTRARLALLAATRQVLRNGLALLGVSAPDKM